MDKEQRMVFLVTQSLCAFAEIQGMLALNHERALHGYSLAYDEEAFLDVPNKYGLAHNAVIDFLGGQ